MGQYVVGITLPTTLQGAMGSQCIKYLCDDSFKCCAELNVCENFVHDLPGVQNSGWQIQRQESKTVLHWSSGGTQCFAISYNESRDYFQITIAPKLTHMLRVACQYSTLIALANHCVGLHGVTVICKDQVVILSAPSGTGKTTLAKLLQKYCNVAVVNGDFALLSISPNGDVIFEPTPFCGSSAICYNYRLKVDKIVFLEQSKKNTYRALSTREAMTKMMNNVFIPEWDQELISIISSAVIKMIENVPVSTFAFAPTQEAAEYFKAMVTK